jgi:hypothetical protein
LKEENGLLQKTIKAKLSLAHKKWINSIDDEKVQELAKKNSFISGGAIVSLLQDEEPNDYDIYFTDFDTTLAVADYYKDRWNKNHDTKVGLRITHEDSGKLKTKNELFGDHYAEEGTDNPDIPKRVSLYIRSAGIAEDDNGHESENGLTEADYRAGLGLEPKDKTEKDKGKHKPVFMSPNAITLDEGIQLIVRFYGEPEEVHKNFDYVHCTAYWKPHPRGSEFYKKELLYTGDLVLPSEALASIMTKELRYVGSRYPIASILRLRKFISRGYTINAGQVVKMILQIQKFDLSDPDVLQDQLTGVDLAYMQRVLDIIQNKKADDPMFNLDSDYLIKVVEKIFDGKDDESDESM